MFSFNAVRNFSSILEFKTVSQVVIPSLLLASILSFGVYTFNKNTLSTNYHNQFEKDSAQIVSNIDAELNRYHELLYSTNAFISSLDTFDHSVLKNYIYQLDLENFPAFYAINYIEEVEHANVESFYQNLYNKYAYEDKHIKSKIDENLRSHLDKALAVNKKHFIVTYFEPINKGLEHLGKTFDSNPSMEKILEDGKNNRKIIQSPAYLVGQLFQDVNTWVAFSRLSSYRSPYDVTTFKGTIGVGVRLDESLFGGARKNFEYLNFQVIDETNKNGRILYDSRYSRKSVSAIWPSHLDKERAESHFSTTIPLQLLKSNVKVEVFTNECPPNIGSMGLVIIKAIGTFFITFLLFFFMFHRWFILSKDKNKAYDIAEKITEELRTMAYTDTLTQLNNRRSFVENLDEFVHANPNGNAYLFFLDLDGFKTINDTLGHNMGDIVLQQFADRLRKLAFHTALNCYRIGGDEFTILIKDINKEYSQEDIKSLAQQVLSLTHDAFIVGNEKFKISSSIGIAHFPVDGATREELFQNSDLAMYYTKHHGKNNFSFYSEYVGKQIKGKKQIETLLSTALENNEFYLLFQPKTLQFGDTYKPVGAEILLRWNNEKLGEITPDQFIPAAEETGLINDIGHWVFEESVKKVAQWNKSGMNGCKLSINLSVVQFSNPNLVSDFVSILEKYDVSPQQIILEITESVVTNDMNVFKTMLKNFSNHGFKISMDDFGTGYSSLYFLRRLEINEIKIDKTFIKNILVDETDCVVLDAIIDLAQKLELNIVVEGVETEKQLAWFKGKGNLQMQGFYFSKPLQEAEFLAYWKNYYSEKIAVSP